MKPAPSPDVPGRRSANKSQTETIAELNARCDGSNQFENFDRVFRKSLTISKAALLKEEARQKRAREMKRAKKPLLNGSTTS